MKKLFSIFAIVGLMLSLASCGDDDDTPIVVPPVDEGNVVKSGFIKADETWSSDKIYELAGRVIVTDGATLTIEAGTIVKAREGEGAASSALVIARGAKIDAQGTGAAPIIFTSVLDDIELGQKAGTNLDETRIGLWGGVLILGNAPISAGQESVQIEGIPPSVTEGLYGGTTEDDDSGIFKYVSIRHGGTLLGGNNEINGLTLGGVGSKTEIEFVEVVANKDDGIELFGGTVNVTNALVWAQGDDAYDIDQAYKGTIDNFIYIAGVNSDHGLEIDGPEGLTTGSFTMKNGSLKGIAGAEKGEFADFRDGATGTVMNSYFFGGKSGADVELDADGSVDPDDDDKKLSDNPKTSDKFKSGELKMTDLEFSDKDADGGDITIDDIFTDKWSLASSTPGDSRDADAAVLQATENKATFNADNSVVSTATVGADKSKFEWTYAASKGALTDF